MSEVADAKIHGHGVARRVHTVHRSSEEGAAAHTHTTASRHPRAPHSPRDALTSTRPMPCLKKKKNPREPSLSRLAHRPQAAKRRDPRSAHVAAAAAAAAASTPPPHKKEAAASGPTRIIYPATNQEADS